MSTLRSRILEAARQHFREVGARHARVQQICELAGVSRTSFYREFGNLDGIAVALAVQRWTHSITATIQEVAGLPAPDAWREFIARLTLRSGNVTGWGSDDDRLIHIIDVLYQSEDTHLRAMVDAVRPFIEQGQRQGYLRTDVALADMADCLFRLIWAMTSVPFVGVDAQARRMRYIDHFVLPCLARPMPTDGTGPYVLGLLAQVTQRLDHLEARCGD